MARPRTSSFFGRIFARLVLAWYVLAMGVALAAPLVNPKAMDIVCSAAGSAKFVVHGDEGAAPADSAGMDCALCAPTGAPPVSSLGHVAPVSQVSFVLNPLMRAALAASAAAPLPARGPPLSA